MKLSRLFFLPFLLLAASTTSLHADSWTEGGKRILVLDCGYADTGPSGTTTQQVNDRFKLGQAGGLDELLRKDSFGRAWYSEVVHVKVTLPGNKSDYSGAGFAAYRDGMATAGLSSGDYDRIMTLAAGTVTGSTAYAFVRGTRSHYNGLPGSNVAHHELHHNMGLNHAQRWETPTDPRQEGGSNVEYGDGDDVMGGGALHINAQYKYRLDYLKEANGEVAEGTNGNTYRIFDHSNDDLSPTGTDLRAVWVPIEGSNIGGDRQLWISYTYARGDDEMKGGVQIHASRQARDSYSHRLDMSPGDHLTSDSSGAKEDIRSAELAIGKTYTDTEIASDYSHPGAISITPIAKGSTSGVNWIDVVVHSESVGVNSVPTGGAISGVASANAGQSIALTASATDPNGDTLAYFWDFGDGTFSTDSAALQNKSWSSPGYYLVDVTISDRRGGVTTAQHWVNVGGQTSRTPENDATTGDLFYEYYEGIFTVLPNFDQLLPDSTGTIATVGIPLAARGDDFAVRITGYLDVPATDVYRFVLRSEDGSRLFIGDTLVVNNTGERNSPEEVEGNIALNAGQHAITVEMRHRSGAETLELSWATLGQTPTQISAGSLAGHDWQSNTVPTVSITTPSNGGAVDFGTTPTFTASASDADGIATVQFYLNGTFLGEDTSFPFELPWEASFAGTFDLTARAVDATGRTANTTHSFSVTTPDANQVAINFVGSDSYNYNVTWPLNAGESAGAVYLNDHWNNFTHETLRTGAALTDQTGAPATVRVSQWSGLTSSAAPNYPLPQFRSQANTSTANGKLFKGLNWRRFDQDVGSAPFVTFDRIPYQEYEVYVYFDYDETGGDVNSGGTERPADTTVQEFILSSLDANAPSPDPIFGKSSLSLNDGVGDWPTYDTWTNFKEATAATNSAPSSELLGNYVVFRGQYAHSFKLLVDSGGDRYVNGLQIVEVDPTIPRVHIVGGAESLTSSESGSPFSYEAVLTIEPTSPVAVSIEAPESLELDTYLLYFTASNWNIPQTVTIYPQDNNTVDGNRALSIVHNPSGGNYSAAPVTTLPVTLTDDETAFVTATAVASVITETGGGSADFRVIRQGGDLSSSLTVDFTLSGAAANDGSDYTLSGTGVTHNTGSGTGSVTIAANEAFANVTVTAINDATSEGIEDATLTLGYGLGYLTGDPANASIDISDSATGLEFTESFAANAFDLESKTITFTPDGSDAFYSAEVTSTASFHALTSGHTEYVTSSNITKTYAVNVSANPVPFFGVAYNNIFVGNNGYVTFGTSDTESQESASSHFDLPRISMFFTNMYSRFGTTSIKVGRTGTNDAARTVVTVTGLEEYPGLLLKIDYQIELFDNGTLRLTWLNAGVDDAAFVGLSGGVGGASSFSSVDLSALTPTSGPSNNAPFFASTVKTGAVTDVAYSLDVLTDDLDGDTLTLTAPTKPAWLSLSSTGNGAATLSGTPTTAGEYSVILEVDDGTAAPVQQSFILTVSEALVSVAPSIIEQPSNQSLGYNENASFRVVATGTPTLTYQWYFGDQQIIDDGSHYVGATSSQLSINGVVNEAGGTETSPNGDVGSYYCVVTSPYGQATSSNATLTVGDPTAPSFDSHPASQDVTAGSSAVFTATVSGTTPLSYQWQKDGVDLTDGGDISGATSASLTIANAEVADEGAYRVLATNPAAADVASNAGTLAINSIPQVTVDSPVGSSANLSNLTDRLVLETTITDDGKPNPPAAVSVIWSQVSGPGTATFEDASAEDTTVTFDQTGDYVLRITVNDGLDASSADVNVGVGASGGVVGELARWRLDAGNGFAASNVSSDLESASNLTDIGINGTGWDGIGWEFDGLPAYPAKTDYATVTLTGNAGLNIDLNGGSVTFNSDFINGSNSGDGYTVDVISDPAGSATTLTLGTSDNADTNFNSGVISGFNPANVVELRVYFNNGQSWGDIQLGTVVISGAVELNSAPVPNAGADAAAVTSVATGLSGSATDDGNPNPPAAISYQWSQLSGSGVASFLDATSPTSDVTFSASGTYVLRLIAGDGAVKTADDVTYTVSGTATVPDAPSTLSASATSSSQIDLAWTDNSNNESGFKIERSTTGGGAGFSLLTTTDANATSYSDTGLSQTTTYYYRVASTNVAGDSAFTSEASDTTQTPPPGTLQLTASSWTAGEGDGTVTITVERVSGSNGAVSIEYTTSNGTATAGSDYTAATGTLNWIDGDTADKTFDITLADDGDTESSETITVTLSNPGGSATLGSPSSGTVTITDNDLPGILALESATYAAGEGDVTVVLTVTRTGGSKGAASVNFATANGSATAGIDYTANSGSLNWSDGESTSKTITVTITDDGTSEGNEDFSVTLSGASGASLGSPSASTVTITDNDFHPSLVTGLVGWYDAQALSGSDGTQVTSWADTTGGSNSLANDLSHVTSGHQTPATTAVAPTLQTVSLNGYGYRSVRLVSGNAGEYELLRASSLVASTLDTRTIITVYKGGDVTAGGRPLGFGSQTLDNSANAEHFNISNDGNGSLRYDGAFIGSHSPGLNTTDMFIRTSVMESKTSFDEYLDVLDGGFADNQVLSNGIPSNPLNDIVGDFFVGDVQKGNIGGETATADFDILEVLVFSTALSDTDRQNIQDWLKTKYTTDPNSAATPTAPSGLTATTLSTSEIDLAWTDNSGNETGFKIERSTSSGTGFSLIHTTAADATSYSDTGLTAGTTYYYRVSATNAEGDSATTSEASDTTLAAPAPGTLQLTASSWNPGEGDGTVTITVERISGSSGAVSIGYATSNGTATAGSDYTAASGTLNWADGDTANKTFDITIADDGDVESDETITVTLSSPGGSATLGAPDSGTVTITDNDAAAPTALWSEDFEGISSGSSVTTSANLTGSILGGTTTANAATDSGDLFGNGTSNLYARVVDSDGANAARLGHDSGVGTFGSQVATFAFKFRHNITNTVNQLGFRLSSAEDAWTNFNYQIIFRLDASGNGEATTGGTTAETFAYDESVTNDTQIIANNGSTALTDYYGTEDLAPGKVDVWMNGILVGNDIEFTDNALGNTNANFRSLSMQSFNGANGVDFLIDDLAVYAEAYVAIPPTPGPGTLALSASTYDVDEAAGTVTVTATRSSGSLGAVSIDYATSNGTAIAGSDYTAASGTLNWADGDSANKTFDVTLANDGTYTGDRSFTVSLSNPGGSATLGTPSSASVTINEDEAVPPPPAGAPLWLSVDPVNDSSIIITWDDNTADETGFLVERATSSGGPWTSVHTAAADADVWTDTGLSASTEYFYRVTVIGGTAAGATSSVYSGTTLSGSNDLIRMRQNALNLMRAIGASRTSSYMTAALTTLSTDAQSALSSIQGNGSWTDVDYTDVVPDDTWSLDLHYNRLQDMARAWDTPGTTLYQDTATLTAILNGIDFIETIVNTSTNRNNGNWWWWNIGIPQRYAPTLLLVREELGSTRLNQATATLDYLIGSTLLDGTEGAQNWIWQGMNRIHHGLIDSNTADLTEGAGYVSTYVVMATPGVDNGIMPDYAFQAHGATVSTGYRSQLATGQYGASFMKDVPKFTFFAEGTGYQLSAAKQQILADFALEGSRWTVFGQFSDISVEGRAYTRDNRSAANPLSGLMALANTPGSPAQSVAAASAKRILQDWTFEFLPEDAGLAALVSEMPETAAQPTGFREYNYSDYAVARQDDWMISLKAISDRMLIGEDINGENLKGRHLSSGVTWIYTGDEYRLNNVIPTIDHDRLPGTTIEKGLNLNDEYHYTPGLRSFVGSASTGTGGASAMDFHSRANFPSESDLEAKKSWFFFGDSMVAVGSGITGTVSNKTVETVVNQRPMGTINDNITVDGTIQSTATATTTHTGIGWAHEGDLGYVFPGGAEVKIKRATQSGKWSDIGSGSTTTYSNPMVSLWFDHGTTPTNADYAYAVLPNATAAETQTIAGNSTFEILENSTALHAVKHHGENAAGAVFWQAGQIDRVSVDTPSVVFWDINGATLELALSEPDHSSATIELTFAGDLTPVSLPTGVSSAVSNGSTVITFTVANGQNYDATFTINSLGSLPTVAPTISPAGGLFTSPVDVTLSHPDGSATIRYTTDGTDPDGTSPIYSAGFQVTSTTTVKAIAQVSGQGDSTITSQTFAFVDTSYFINAGEGGYTTDGSNTWQEIDLASGTGSGGANNSNPVTLSAVTLSDSAGSTAGGITLAVTPTGIASSTVVLNPDAAAGDFNGNPFGWFDPSDADQRETFVFEGSGGSQYWTYTFDGFDPGDTVNFQFVVRRNSATGTRLTTLSGGVAGGSLTDLYTSQETDEAPQFVTMELTGSASYEFRLSNTSATLQWCPTPNAIAVFVSEAVTASAPAAASGLGATVASSSQINLSWTDNSGDETGFKVQRSATSISGFSTIHTTAADATSYNDTGLSVGTEYFYRVIATNASGDSAPTTEASATTFTATQQWYSDNGLPTDGSGDGAPGADPDGDGVSNLLERAFGSLPNNTASVELPTGTVAQDGGNDYLMITYRRLTGGTGTTGVDYTAEGLTYTVEYDEDLVAPWGSGAVTQVGSASNNGDGTETVTVRLNVSISGATEQFTRVKVTEAP